MAGANQPSSSFNLSDVSLQEDPAGRFGQILEMGPIFRGKMPMLGKAWFATSWLAVTQSLRRTGDFVREPAQVGRKYHTWIQRILPSLFRKLSNSMLNRDGQDHRRLRALVEQAFQRQGIEQREGRLQAIVDQHLDAIEESFRGGQSSVDFMPAFFRPYPLTVICELLGLPQRDRPRFMKWFSGFSQVRSMTDILRMLPSLRRTMQYLDEQFAEVRKQPRPGLLTALVQAETDGDRLSKDELLSMAMLLLLAGHETTVHLISNSVLTLLQKPDVKEPLLQDWSLSGATIEEVLRWTAMIHVTKPRFVARDMDFHGTPLARGDMLVPLIACANFDPAEFDQPDEFRMHRQPNRHLTFGNGPHVCLGMNLARTEARLALQQVFSRWPELSADFDIGQPDFGRRIGMRTLKSMRLRRS